MAFSRQESKLDAIKIKQRRARTQASLASPEMKLKHPQWCRDAATKNFTQLNLQVKDETEKAQKRNEKFQEKLHAKS